MRPKTVTPQAVTAERGVNLIERIVLEMQCRWSPTQAMDVGIDGTIELCRSDTGEALGVMLFVQSKATERRFLSETPEGFDYVCDERDLEYWLKGNAPVILVVSRPSSGEAYWVSVKDYFAGGNVPPGAMRIHFQKAEDRFTAASFEALLRVGAKVETGLYFAPSPRHEELVSNLLPVTRLPPAIFVASTEYTDRKTLWSHLNQRGAEVGGEWLVKERKLVSFLDLAEPAWAAFCDRGTVDEFGIEEWSLSEDDDRRREFVQLLNAALRAKLYPDVRWMHEARSFAFTASPDRRDRRVSYQLGKSRHKRLVFSAYRAKSDGHVIAYRHLGFAAHFGFYDGQWYLEVEPTYIFTKDGREMSRYHEEAVSRMKQLDRNQAVLGNLRVCAARLQTDGDLFRGAYPFLAFGDLVSLGLPAGIDDAAWGERPPPEAPTTQDDDSLTLDLGSSQ